MTCERDGYERGVLVLAGCLFALVACGSSGPSEKGICEEYYELYCARTESCSGAAGLSALGYASVDACNESLKRIACAGATPFCHSDGNFDSGNAQSCIAEMKSVACSGVLPTICEAVCNPGDGGGPFHADACRAEKAAYCEKTFACKGQAGLDYLGWSTVEECTVGNQTKCATDDYCGFGKSFSRTGANRCAADLQTQACSVFEFELPSSCERQMCVGG